MRKVAVVGDGAQRSSGPTFGGWTTFVAIGDSFTEGVGDPDPVTGLERGWADRVATTLARHHPGLRYANLAVRGTLLDGILTTQVPAALDMRPDLVTLCAAGNDLLRPAADLTALAARIEAAVAALRAAGADVVLFTGFDTRRIPVLRLVSRRMMSMNIHMHAIAHRHGARVVDLWAMSPLADPRSRGDDRLHLNADGHARVADRVCEVLGVPPEGDWRREWGEQAMVTTWRWRRGEDARWARRHLVPWVQRRLQGRSSSIGRAAKRPELAPVC